MAKKEPVQEQNEHADKRSVSTDALETLGMIINENEKRDAIHLAVLPVQAGQDLKPGNHIGLIEGKAFENAIGLLGIVDPFLRTAVKKDEWFWLVIYPRKIKSLRHVWTHPGVDDNLAVSAEITSEKWLRDFADSKDLSFGKLMMGADNWVKHQDYLVGGSNLEGEHVPKEFWAHYETYMKTKVPEDRKENFFTCSC